MKRLYPFLLLGLIVAISSPAFAQFPPVGCYQETVVCDSVKVEFDIFTDQYFEAPYYYGTTQSRAIHLDLLEAEDNWYNEYNYVARNEGHPPFQVSADLENPEGMVYFMASATGYQGGSHSDMGQWIAAHIGYNSRAEWYAMWITPDGTPVSWPRALSINGLTVQFDGTKSYEAEDGEKLPVVSYDWYFGDGDGSDSAAPMHTFDEGGTYAVRLTVTDDDGDIKTRRLTVTVGDPDLAVYTEILDLTQPGNEILKGDSVLVRTVVENNSDSPIFNVTVPSLVSLPCEFPPESDGYYRQCPSFQQQEDPGEDVIPVLGAGATHNSVQRWYRVTSEAYFRVDGENFKIDSDAYPVATGVYGEDSGGEPIAAEQTCGYNPCGNSFVVLAPNFDIALETRSVGHINQVRAGAIPGPDWHSVSFAQIDPDGSDGEIPVCRSGCIELEATVTDAVGGLAEGELINFEIAVSGAPDEDYGGDFACQRVSIGQFAVCADGTDGFATISAESDEDGIARAWYALPGGMESNATVSVKAWVDGLVRTETETEVTATATVEELSNETIDLSASANKYGRILHNISNGVATIAIGEYCESFVGWMRDGVIDDALALARHRRNVARLYASGIHAWVCDAAIETVGSAGSMFALLTAINEVADPVKKVTDLFRFIWFAQVYEIDKASDMVTIQGPLPGPPFVWYDGDINEFVGDVTGTSTTNTPDTPTTGHNMVIKEVTGLVPLSSSIVDEDDYRPDPHNGSLRLNYSSPRGSHDALISFGYVPLADAISIGSDGFLVENETFETATASVNQGDVTVDLGNWVGEIGDYVYIQPETPGEFAEVLQVIDVQTAQPREEGRQSSPLSNVQSAVGSSIRGGVSLEFASPVQFNHGENARVYWVSEGEVGPPPPPTVQSVLGPEAPVELAWINTGATIATSFDIQVAEDEAFTTLLIDEQGLTDTQVDVSSINFMEFETYYWRTRATNRAGQGDWSAGHDFTPGTTIVSNESAAEQDGDEVPGEFMLSSAYPNPFNPSTNFNLAVPFAGQVQVDVYDMLGRRVAVLQDGDMTAGTHTLRFEAHDLPSGVYVVRAMAEGFGQTRSVTLLK